MILLFQLIVLIFSVMVHEVSHGAVAYKLGDDTAKVLGRLNLNPLKHIDFMGSIFLPLFLILVQSPVLFGWAKPVPYNPHNLKNPKKGAALIGAAGPLSNLALALIFGLLIRLTGGIFGTTDTSVAVILFFNIIVFINILLAIFNLVPIPPLDGSKLLFALLPHRYSHIQHALERYGIFILIFFIFYGGQLISPLMHSIYYFIVGQYAIF
ncbi:MAG: site-2 protease family protein [bacterium]|nr:site-2 protease family protein [bacterium]